MYDSLVHTDSIRLIELLPGLERTPLACNLVDVRKSHNPDYQALSYAWGEPVFSHTIREAASSSVLHITVNLFHALQALRDEHNPRILWADSLSINQLDLQEKGHQVALMGPIYRDAQRVVVWLGFSKMTSSSITTVFEDLLQAFKAWEMRDKKVIYRRRATPTKFWKKLVRLSALKLIQQPWYEHPLASQTFLCKTDLRLPPPYLLAF